MINKYCVAQYHILQTKDLIEGLGCGLRSDDFGAPEFYQANMESSMNYSLTSFFKARNCGHFDLLLDRGNVPKIVTPSWVHVQEKLYWHKNHHVGWRTKMIQKTGLSRCHREILPSSPKHWPSFPLRPRTASPGLRWHHRALWLPWGGWHMRREWGWNWISIFFDLYLFLWEFEISSHWVPSFSDLATSGDSGSFPLTWCISFSSDWAMSVSLDDRFSKLLANFASLSNSCHTNWTIVHPIVGDCEYIKKTYPHLWHHIAIWSTYAWSYQRFPSLGTRVFRSRFLISGVFIFRLGHGWQRWLVTQVGELDLATRDLKRCIEASGSGSRACWC